MNGTNRKVYGQNIKKGSRKLLGHPLNLKVHLDDKHLHSTCPTQRNGNKCKWNAQNPDAI